MSDKPLKKDIGEQPTSTTTNKKSAEEKIATTTTKPISSDKESRRNSDDSDDDVDTKQAAGQAGVEEDDATMDMIKQFFAQKLGIGGTDEAAKEKVIDELTFDGLTKHWKEKGFKNIITMVGAGISTSAGIPDFRSPGTGLYNNLKKYNLPNPTAIFDVDYFEENPKPFFALAKELYPGTFNPTISHYFVRLLHEKGLLVRHYTQNIDTLERIAGIPENKLVEAHGTFYTNHCLKCRKLFDMKWMKNEIFEDRLPECDSCGGVVKPDIVFFGENLPQKFYTQPDKDFPKCDLLIIMGTSLEVQPFASLTDHAGKKCVRLLINREKVGQSYSWFGGSSLKFDHASNTRDVAYIGNCDDGVVALAEALGWGDELRELQKREWARLAEENLKEKQKQQKQQNQKEKSSVSKAASTSKK